MGNSTTTGRKAEASRELRPHPTENYAGEHRNSYYDRLRKSCVDPFFETQTLA